MTKLWPIVHDTGETIREGVLQFDYSIHLLNTLISTSHSIEVLPKLSSTEKDAPRLKWAAIKKRCCPTIISQELLKPSKSWRVEDRETFLQPRPEIRLSNMRHQKLGGVTQADTPRRLFIYILLLLKRA